MCYDALSLFAAIWTFFHFVKGDPAAKFKTLAVSIMFFEFLLNSVTTLILRTFACERFDDGHHYLKAQLSLKCHGSTHHFYVSWAAFMIFVYPIGVPLLMFVVLYVNRHEITRVMTIVIKRTEKGELLEALDPVQAQLEQEHNANALLRATTSLFEQYDPGMWPFGIFALYVRMLETSFLVFIPKTTTKALIATAVALIAIFVLRELAPWR